MKAYVSTYPFSETTEKPMQLLRENGIELRKNEYGRKLTTDELAEELGDSDVLIAGTEYIDERVFKKAPNLKLISRVGIGLDNIDFKNCIKRSIRIAYTPDAPTMAVAEMVVGFMIGLSRSFRITDREIKSGIWQRRMGNLLYGKTIGVIGMGRIGKSVIHLLSTFNVNFLVNEIVFDYAYARLHRAEFVSKEELLQKSDIVTVHVPLKNDTINLIDKKEFEIMQQHSILINTSRGGIVNEEELYNALKHNKIESAAVDVFREEPYKGRLTELDNCLLTAHMGAASKETREQMEVQAVGEVIRFKNGEKLKNEVFENA